MFLFQFHRLARTVSICATAMCITAPLSANLVSVVSTGFATPEAIVPVPSGFGGLAAGSYLIPDANHFISRLCGSQTCSPGALYSMPASGGAPTLFADLGVMDPLGGVFLPASYGSIGGDFLAVGANANGNFTGEAVTVDSTGASSVLITTSTTSFASAVIAPEGFGAAAGQVLISNQDGFIYLLHTDGTFSLFATLPGVTPFGLAFDGGKLLVSDGHSGKIYAVDSSGNVSLFSTVPLSLGQDGLRQMASVAGGGLLPDGIYVSVASSGGDGSLDVVNASTGALQDVLEQATVGAPLNPRGIYIPDLGHVWFANTDPGILTAPASAFSPVPEPASWPLLALGLVAIAFIAWRKQHIEDVGEPELNCQSFRR